VSVCLGYAAVVREKVVIALCGRVEVEVVEEAGAPVEGGH
jgi:hypothetical protein